MTFTDDLIDGEFFKVFSEVYTNLLGEPVAALIFFGATGTAFYIYQERAIIPVVMTILIGGVILAELPAAASRVVIILVLLAISAIVYLLYQTALGSSRFRS
jgi:hypothetical protein